MFDDDDWGFEENSSEYNTYEHSGDDLSYEINNGHRVRDLRLLAEIGPETLAENTSISAQDLLAMEAGILQLDENSAKEIAAVLNVKLSDIWVAGE